MKSLKGRYWSCIAWIESLPNDWKIKLEKSGLPCVVSPLHDKDINDNGDLQKAHYHVLLAWDGPTTLNNVQAFAESVGLGTYIELVRSVSNIIDYMTHQSYSSVSKVKYNPNLIEYINCKESDFVKLGFKKIVAYIRDNKIKSFNKLVDALLINGEDELLEYCSNHPYYVNLYISSLKIDIDKDLKATYSYLKDLANSIDERGRITVDKKTYFRLLEYFEQIDLWFKEN